MCAIKAQHTARAALDALAAGKAVTVAYGLAQPGMAADVHVDRAVKVADPALHAAGRIRNDYAAYQRLAAFLFMTK